MVTFCSLVTASMPAQARVLADSVRRQHPDARVLFWAPENVDPGSAEIAPLDGEPSIPALLAHALADAETAVYLDPEVCVYDSLEPLIAASRDGAVALVPRVASLPDDGEHPNYAALLDAGEVSPALVAVSRGEGADAFLTWWARRREESDVSEGRRLTLAREQLALVALLTDPGCNVCYWNLHERPLERGRDGVTAAGSPLRAFHFAGFRPDRPYWLSPGRHPRAGHRGPGPVGAMRRVRRAAPAPRAGRPPCASSAGMQRLGNGQRIDHLVRALWAQALDDGQDFGDPLAPAAADAFVAWMREPAEHGGDGGVNRYLYAAYLTRPDLQREFPDLDGADGTRLVDWAWQHGRREVLAELLPTTDEVAAVATSSPLAVNVIGYLGETLGLAEAARLYIAALQAAGGPGVDDGYHP